MDIIAEIIMLVDFIEANLTEKPSLDELAVRAGFSKFHLHRLFKSVTGQAVGDYMLSRRLAQSLGLLSRTKLRLDDIAAELGFYDHSAFYRAFHGEFGVSPSHYRRNPVELPMRGRLTAADLCGDGNAVITRPKFVSRPAFTVTGMPCRVYYMDNEKYNKANLAGIDFFEKHSTNVPGCLNRNIYIGLTTFTEDDEDSSSWYMPSVEVAEGSKVPPGMTRRRVPAQDYAVFRYTGSHNREHHRAHGAAVSASIHALAAAIQVPEAVAVL
jgi:AraC family transcriptional regulator